MAIQSRPPIVTILGHVDHGKTSLLDAIRKSSVAAGEAGGITQHIGAYQAVHDKKLITFIDTPGHAAFKAMRSRGASVTDIVVLVVSAVEGPKPQTMESIDHIKAAGVPYIVALTKMDLPDANPEMVKAQLTEHEVFVEGYGGDVEVVPVSAKKGTGLPKLLETILLLAELHELKADADAPLEAVVIESERDKRRGTVATLLVKQGTLHRGDTLYTADTKAKVRNMSDALGKAVEQAGPSTPVQVMGWEKEPTVGSIVTSTPVAQTPVVVKPDNRPSIEVPTDKPVIKLMLKADTSGTLEAIKSNLSEEIILLDFGVGDITEADVLLADASKCRILGFHVGAPSSVTKLAEMLGVKLKMYEIIYELFEDLQKLVLKLIEPTIDEEELAVAEVKAVFDMRGEHIAGCKILTGEFVKGVKYHVKRAEVIIANPTRLKSLKRGKEDIESAKAGTECGIVFKDFDKAMVGDQIIAYRVKDEL